MKYERLLNMWKYAQTSLIIKDMQMRTTLRYHFSPNWLAKIQKFDKTLH